MSVKCNRCGRALKAKLSIQRGYGPVCYKLICGTDQVNKKYKTFVETGEGSFDYTTLEQREYLITYHQNMTQQAGGQLGCWSCRKPIHPSDIHFYPHDGGLSIPGFEENQWVSWNCSHCGYSTSQNKQPSRSLTAKELENWF